MSDGTTGAVSKRISVPPDLTDTASDMVQRANRLGAFARGVLSLTPEQIEREAGTVIAWIERLIESVKA